MHSPSQKGVSGGDVTGTSVCIALPVFTLAVHGWLHSVGGVRHGLAVLVASRFLLGAMQGLLLDLL
jgi:hypothetical protein